MRHSIVRVLILALILTHCGSLFAHNAGNPEYWIATWAASAQGFVDFGAATRDPANPKQFLKLYNNSDNLHPADAGHKAMADAVDLSIFTRLR